MLYKQLERWVICSLRELQHRDIAVAVPGGEEGQPSDAAPDSDRLLPAVDQHGEPTGPSRRGTVPAHLFAYQLEYGVIARLGWSNIDDAVLCHQCDFAGCTNPAHMQLGTNRSNRSEYELRRRNIASPLADVRGPAGRTRAIAAAIRIGIEQNVGTDCIEERIAAAEAAGCPLSLW
ncbi:hypothetical protein [Rhodococcus sp. 24CO]|uniref:hypothetical protein n=1 Tax=Rhodococcus sp. 24CO TaxID=3117460 RepID=UPI003D354211